MVRRVVTSGSSLITYKHVEMAFSFYLISEETKGYFAISRQISATSAPKDIMTDKIPRITIMIL